MYASASQSLPWFASLQGVSWTGTKNYAVDPYGSLLISGNFTGEIVVDGASHISHGGADIILYKLSPSGEFFWAITLGGDGDDYATAIATDYQGGAYIAGLTSSSSMVLDPLTLSLPSEQPAGGSGFILKLDTWTGEVQWAKSIQGDDIAPMGLVSNVASEAVWLVGSFSGLTMTVGEDELVLTNHDQGEAARASSATSDGFLIKLSSASDGVVHGNSFSGAGNGAVLKIVADLQRSIYLAGYSSSSSLTYGSQDYPLETAQSYIMKIETLNDTVSWIVGVDGSPIINDMTVDTNGDLVVVGLLLGYVTFTGTTTRTLANPNPNGIQTGYVAKISPTGEVMWISLLGGVENAVSGAFPLSVVTGSCNNVLVSGFFSAVPLTFGATNLTSMNGGASDAFIAIITAGGDIAFAMDFGGTSDDKIWGLAAGGNIGSSLLWIGSFSLFYDGIGDSSTVPITVLSLVSISDLLTRHTVIFCSPRLALRLPHLFRTARCNG